jgi:hypothetical protein
MNFFDFTGYKLHTEIVVCMMTVLSWIVDFTLLLRLAAIYPPRTQARSTTLAIFAFPVLVKLGRLIVLAFFIKKWVTLIGGDLVPDAVVMVARGPFSKAEWFLEFVDNA